MQNRKAFITGLIMSLICIPHILNADDTDIFGGSSINLAPNVLIIFDKSGSMADEIEVPGTTTGPYNPAQVYSGAYDNTQVYRERCFFWCWWEEYQYIGTTVDAGEIACDDARSSLNLNGAWTGLIRDTSPHTCTAGSGLHSRHLSTGNYLNWLALNAPTYRRKIDVAKDTICNVIDTTSGVRWGIMIFNNNQGGRIIAEIKDRTSSEINDLKTTIQAQEPGGWTPLAETLTEAGRYFAGAAPLFGASSVAGAFKADGTYQSPIDWRCRQNHIIIITDGMSTQDRDSVLYTTGVYMGKTIGDFDNDGQDNWNTNPIPDNGSHYLDDVAKYLYENDLITSGNDAGGISYENCTNYQTCPKFDWQHVTVHAIGFETGTSSIATGLLKRTADKTTPQNPSGTEQHGRGYFYTTSDPGIDLASAMRGIITGILSLNEQFISPVVPVSRTNKTYAENGVYLGAFAPDNEKPGLWKGNLKKFGLSRDADLLDVSGNLATDAYGTILDTAHACWYTESGNDGMIVERGGLGKILVTGNGGTARNFMTRKTSGGAIIDFSKTTLTKEDLGLTTDALKDDLIDFVRAEGVYAAAETPPTGTRQRAWVLGDILHSKPAVLYDTSGNRNVLFFGANDGFLHCVLDWDKGTSNNLADDQTWEEWSFIPWELVSTLQYLPPRDTCAQIVGDDLHDIYVDGSPTVYAIGSNVYLSFGLRRGGQRDSVRPNGISKYYTLNVTDYTAPTFAWDTQDLDVGEILGEAWSTPQFRIMKDATGTSRNVLLLAGGYDVNEDSDLTHLEIDARGRAIYTVDAETGTLVDSINYANYDKMKYCIVDLSSYDDNDNGIEDIIYAGDLGGDLFVFEDKNEDGTWNKRRLFMAGYLHQTSPVDRDIRRKFFCSPGIVQEPFGTGVGDYIYIGSGDREHPTAVYTSFQDRFYAIKNRWTDEEDLNESNLVDLTSGLLMTGTELQKQDLLSQIDTLEGWYFNLDTDGERVVSSPIVFNKVVYFTTFTPSAEAGTDQCSSGTGAGTARLYAVDYKTGNAVFDFNSSGALEKADRAKTIGTGIPSEPVVVVTETGTSVLVSTEKKVQSQDTQSKREFKRFYWLQQ